MLKILVIALLFLFSSNSAWAGFGISPPYVINDKLLPGSHYEQKITLVRGEPNEDLKAEITIDAPEIESWLTIEPGKEFILAKGQQQMPMIVKVDVPKDADFGNYQGYIRIRTAPLEAEKGKVSVVLGARIDVDLTVSEKGLFDFLVRSVDIPDLEEKGWPIKYFMKIKVLMKIENTGNVEGSPNRVLLDVYDNTGKNLLESKDDTKLEKIKPFETKEIFAEFPTKLGVGQYWGLIKIFKGDEVSKEEKLIFSIVKGSFSTRDWLIISLAGLAGVIVLAGAGYGGYRGYKIWRKKQK